MKQSYLYLIFTLSLLVLGSCENTKTQEKDNQPDYTIQGKAVVDSTMKHLGSNLSEAISTKGFEGAISFCNVEALPITSKFGSENIHVRRTSLKFRNPANQPSESDMEVLKKFEEKTPEIEPLLKETETSANYYHPIFMQEKCLNCHGANLPEERLAILDSLYPNDLAREYKAGDLRGMFVVTVKK